MKKMRFPLIVLLIAGLLTIAFYSCKKNNLSPSVTSDASKGSGGQSSVYSPVTLTCFDATQHSITLTVTAGTTGAPAGFSIQWVLKSTLDALGGVWPTDTTVFCKASFSGVPYGSKNTTQASTNSYNLPTNGSVNVVIGDLLDDQLNQQLGYSTSACFANGLTCGSEYVFRAFAHANSSANRSAYSFGDCTTSACDNTCSHHGYGYYLTQPDLVSSIINDPNGLFNGTLYLGGHGYTADQINAILSQIPNGNGLVILAHQLITAKLNNICGPDWQLADNAFIGQIVPPVGTSSVTPNSVKTLVSDIFKQNNSCLQCSVATP